MDFGYVGGHLPFLLLGWLPWLVMIAGAVVIAVIGLRALLRIDRSLQQIAAQGRGLQGEPPRH